MELVAYIIKSSLLCLLDSKINVDYIHDKTIALRDMCWEWLILKHVNYGWRIHEVGLRWVGLVGGVNDNLIDHPGVV